MPTYVSHSDLTGNDLHNPKGLTYDNGNLSLGESCVLNVDNLAPITGGGTISITKASINELTGALDAGNFALTRINIDSGDISGVTISGGLTWGAPQNFQNVALTNVNIQSGTINTGETMSIADISASGLITANAGIKDISLTAGRVVIVDSDQTITDDADFTFSEDTLTVSKIGAFTATDTINFNSQEMQSVNITSGSINIGETLVVADIDATGDLTIAGTAVITGFITGTAGLKTNLIQNLDGETAIEIDSEQKVTIPTTLDVQTLLLGDNSFAFNRGVTLSNTTTGRLDILGTEGLQLKESDSDTDYATIDISDTLNISYTGGTIDFQNNNLQSITNITSTSISTTEFILDGETLTASVAELNHLDGIESTVGELNQLNLTGITSTELTYLAGSYYGNTTQNKVAIYGTGGILSGTIDTTSQPYLEEIGNGVLLTVLGDLTVSAGTLRLGDSLALDRTGASAITIYNIAQMDSITKTTIQNTIVSLPNLGHINNQEISILSPLTVESGSNVFLNQDLTTDATGVQFGNLQIGDSIFINHSSNVIAHSDSTSGEIVFDSKLKAQGELWLEQTLKFETDNKLYWVDTDTYINGNANQIVIDGDDYVKINADTQVHIGSDNLLNETADGILLSGNVKIIGNLTITGTHDEENVSTLNVSDKRVKVNDGGTSGSGSYSGIVIEEVGGATIDGTDLIQAYIMTSSDRNAWNIKSPANADIFSINTASNLTTLSTDSSNGMKIDDALNITGATDIDSTLNVDSNTDIAGYLKVNTDKFTVASASGDTIVAGTMTIDGHTELNNTLNVDEPVTFQSDFTINADSKMFKIQTNSDADKFTVDTDNGNTDIQGTLNVINAATLHDNVTINANDKTFTIELDNGTPKFTVASASGNTYSAGTLDVTGHTNLDSTTTIDGATIINNGLNITADNKMFIIETSLGVDKFTVDTDNGNTNIEGTLDVTGNVALDEDLIIGDAADDSVTSNSSTWSFPNATSINLKDATVGALKFETDSLVFDTANDRIGINQSTPTRALDIVGGTTMTGDLHVGGNDITFGNNEYISNSVDGTLRFNANLRFDIDSDSSISFRTRETDGPGSKLTIKAQDALNGNNTGGDIWIQAGAKSGTEVDGRIDIKSKSNVRDEMLFDSTKKLCWVDTSQYIEGNGTLLNIEAHDNLRMYSDVETIIDTEGTLTIGAPTLVDIATTEVAISGDIDIEGDIYMTASKKIYWGTDLTTPYIYGTAGGLVVDSNDSLVLNADTNTVWSSPIVEVNSNTAFQINTALLDLNVNTLVDIDTPEVDISGSLDIEGDIDMATGKMITWVDDNQHIIGTDSSITIESDNSFLVEADNDATINCNNLYYGVDGDDTSVVNTFRGSTSDGVFKWRSTPLSGYVEGHFQFSDDIFMQYGEKVFFRDDQTAIFSSQSYQLDIVAKNSGSGKIHLDADEIHLHSNSTFGGVYSDNWIVFDNYDDGIYWVDSSKHIKGTTHNITYNAGGSIAEQHLFKNRITIGNQSNSHWDDDYGYNLNVRAGTNGNHITSGKADFKQNYSVICSDAVVYIDNA